MLNRVIIAGRLVGDPELRNTESGIAVASFSIASERNFRPKEGQTSVDFIQCTAWRGTAEFVARYFKKGKMIIIEGSLRQNKYTNKDGVKRESVGIEVDHCYFSDKKSDSDNNIGRSESFGGDITDADDEYPLLDDDGPLPF